MAEQQQRSTKELIEKEWKIIEELHQIAKKTNSEKTKAFYYQTLAGHIRTLAILLKLLGEPEQTQDLAKILSQITKEAKTMAKRLRQK
ncbi:MAG: hypothetical protein NWE93_00940 [Candidatus Bathyarchaeota archaeon]|nr:hypothetical protein [Candidatus Bathyarchaeota archaeon]